MRPDPKAAFALGLLALLAGLGIAIAFAVDPGLFSRRVAWTAAFPATATLDEGAPVTDHGSIVGRVAGLEWRRAEQEYQVVLRMDPDWQPPADGGLRVAEVNPLRGAIVQVVDGVACQDRREAVGPRAVPTCRRSPGMIEIAGDILARVADVTVQVQRLAGRVGPAASEGGASPLAAMAENVSALSGAARTLVERLIDMAPELRQTLVSAKGASAGADVALRRTDVLLDTLEHDTVVRLNHTLDGADRLVRSNTPQVQASVADVQYVLGASSTSLVRLVAELEVAAGNLAELTRQLRDSPGVLLHGRSLADPPGSGVR